MGVSLDGAPKLETEKWGQKYADRRGCLRFKTSPSVIGPFSRIFLSLSFFHHLSVFRLPVISVRVWLQVWPSSVLLPRL